MSLQLFHILKVKHTGKFKYGILYSAVWFLLTLSLYTIFRINGKSFLWIKDGIYQHFSSFNYLCDYLQYIALNHKLPPAFNYSLGQGADILTTLNSYDFLDPISILSALIFPLNRFTRYTLMIFLKLYLIGIAFSFYCYSIGRRNKLAILAGAISYTFSGANLFSFARHPNFINWAYFFPFLLAGVEIYLRKNKKIPLVLFVFFNIITNYYTFYINAILTVIYVLVHSVHNIAKNKTVYILQREIIKCFKIAGIFCVGIFLSMFICFPTVYAYLTNARVISASGYTASLLHYPLSYYAKTMDDLFAAYISSGYYTYIGFNSAVIVPLILIFTKRKRYLELKTLIIISFLMLCFPIVGRVMNGFGYASNRWGYVLPFYASIALVNMFPDLEKITAKETFYVFVITATYVLCCFLHVKTNTNIQKYTALFMVIWTVFVVIAAKYCKFRYFNLFMMGIVLASAYFQIYSAFASSTGNYVNTFCDRDKITERFNNYSSVTAANLSNEFYRVEQEENQANINGYNHINGTSLWWSMIPSHVSNYYNTLALNTVIQNCNFQGLDGRTGLLELSSVKYYTRPAKEDGLIPYGYKEIVSPNDSFQIFENQYALPIGYTYSGYIESFDYKRMNGIEKELAMLQNVVLDIPLEGFKKNQTDLFYTYLTYDIDERKNVEFNDHIIKVTAANGTLDLTLDIPKDCEIYLYLKGIELLGTVADNNINAIRKQDQYYVDKMARISNLQYNWPVIRNDVTYNLGYGHSGRNTITLKFAKKGEFSIDEIQVIAIPMSFYTTYANNLRQYVLDDINVGVDYVTGTISIPENRILQFSIPYSIGWKAYVDGQETSLLKSNVMFMALPLSSGDHVIELRYSTPYLKWGILITCITIICGSLYIIHNRKKYKSNNCSK